MDKLINWLLEGDISISYLTKKYLLFEPKEQLGNSRKKITTEGWGKTFMDARNPNTAHWGRRFYQPKWICSHYTLLDLRYLEIEPSYEIMETLNRIITDCRATDGSICESVKSRPGDICVNGMFLNYASFFGVRECELIPVVNYLLNNILPDNGLNCNSIFNEVHHSSMHTTIAFLEGMHEFLKAGNTYKKNQIQEAMKNAQEFLLQHKLYKSDKTGEIIDKRWTMLSFPSRWYYDNLRALIFFSDAGVPYDERMSDAIEILIGKRLRDGTWPLQLKHPGNVHFDMEQVGKPSRINTLRALRVLNSYNDFQP